MRQSCPFSFHFILFYLLYLLKSNCFPIQKRKNGLQVNAGPLTRWANINCANPMKCINGMWVVTWIAISIQHGARVTSAKIGKVVQDGTQLRYLRLVSIFRACVNTPLIHLIIHNHSMMKRSEVSSRNANQPFDIKN